MENLISSLSVLFEFLFTQLGYVANFFVSNTLGQIMLGVSLFFLSFKIVTAFLGVFKK